MKENVVDVLVFLFDNYLGMEESLPRDEAALSNELEEAGFHPQEINQAFDWLGTLVNSKELSHNDSHPGTALRVYAISEQYKLDVACQGFLLSLEQMGLLTPSTREMIIDRVMEIESGALTLQQFKRIVGLIILNKAQQEDILLWLDNIIDDETEYETILH
jgi:Smg protein